MTQKKSQQKRKHKRYDCSVLVDGKDGSAFEDLKTIDVSKNGIGFVSRHSIPINKKIAIQLDLMAEDDPVLVVGKVRWVRSLSNSDNYRIGLTFDDVLTGSKTKLNQYFRNPQLPSQEEALV